MNKQRMLDNFLTFVQIDSETKNEQRFKDHLKRYFERLGLEVTEDQAGEKVGSNANNIFVKIPGNDLEPVVLSAHMDTVKPGVNIKPIVYEDKVTSSGDTILGSDCKAGIAIIMEAVESVLERNESHRPIEIAFTIYEEGGLKGARQVDPNMLTYKNILVLDTGGPTSRIVNQSVSQYSLNIEVFGKAAHAGASPEKGINALVIAGAAISNIKLGRIDEETTANIGLISGGEGVNVVMPSVQMKGEARSHSEEKLSNQVKHMIQEFEEAAEFYGGTVQIKAEKEYSAFRTDPNSEYLQSIVSTMKKLGHDPQFVKTGGGSDANIYAQKEFSPVIVSAGMNEVHTKNEYLDLNVFYQSGEFLYHYLKGE